MSEIFNYLTGYSNQKEFRSLLVAPVQLRTRLTELIAREAEHARAGREARIIIKVNSITDDQMIRVLYKASQAGVSIDLIVRGICSLRPGIPGVSDNIRVRSIVGRFLEHSRIYWFQNGGHEEMYIGSADLMERNLDRRVETLTPIRDPEIVEHLRDVVLGVVPARHRPRDGARFGRPLLTARGRRRAAFNAQQFLLKHYSEAARPNSVSRSARPDRSVESATRRRRPPSDRAPRRGNAISDAASRTVIVTAKAIGPSGQSDRERDLRARAAHRSRRRPHTTPAT